jgi:putative thiamine transport system permease protein
MLKSGPILAIAILLGPVLCGLLATLLPAFGYLPVLGRSEFSLEFFNQLFQQPAIFQSTLLSLTTGLGTTFIALGVVIAFVSGWYGTRSFARLQHLISPLLSVPHAAAAFGLAFLIAPSGFLMRLISPWATGSSRPPDVLILQDQMGLAMMAGLIAKEIPFLLLVTLAALPQTQANQSRYVTQTLGYGATTGFILTTWPLVYRQIRLAVFAVIAYAASVVDVAVILGPSRPSTLSVRLAQWMSDPDISLRFMASAGALLQLATVIAAIVIWMFLEKVFARLRNRIARQGMRFSKDRVLKLVSFSTLTLFVVLVFAGLFVLALWSVAGLWTFPDTLPQNLSLRNWTRTYPTILSPLSTTLVTGFCATAIAIILSLACLEREARAGRKNGNNALLLIYLPLIVPQVSFVFGLQVFFLWLGLDASWVALVFVHLIFVLPYVFLSLSDPWRAWDKRYQFMAFGLGASSNRVFWKVRLPMLLKPVLVAAAVGFAVSIGQYLPTILIGAGRLPTITTEAVALASGGNRRIVGVYAFLQMVLPFLAFALAAAIPALLFKNRKGMRAAP